MQGWPYGFFFCQQRQKMNLVMWVSNCNRQLATSYFSELTKRLSNRFYRKACKSDLVLTRGLFEACKRLWWHHKLPSLASQVQQWSLFERDDCCLFVFTRNVPFGNKKLGWQRRQRQLRSDTGSPWEHGRQWRKNLLCFFPSRWQL